MPAGKYGCIGAIFSYHCSPITVHTNCWNQLLLSIKIKTVQKSKVNIFFWSVLAAAGVFMTGCLKTTEPQPQQAKSYLSILHLGTVPPAVGVDVFFNSEKVSSNAFGAGAVSQFYSAIDVGAFSVTFKKAGSADSVVASVPTDIYDSLGFYSIVLYNPTAGSNAVAAYRVQDDFSDLTLDKPFYRFWHASAGASTLGPVDLYIDNVKVQTGRQLADNQYSEYYNSFQATTTGSHTIEVKVQANGADSTIYKSNADVTFQSGNAYTLYLVGTPKGSGSDALSVGVLRAAN